MNGIPVVVFIEGDFECIVLCGISAEAFAWVDGAAFAASQYRGDRFTSFVFWPAALDWIAEMKQKLDANDSTITLDQAKRALDALERAKSLPFPTVPTIVK
jgi:hypothetical protein